MARGVIILYNDAIVSLEQRDSACNACVTTMCMYLLLVSYVHNVCLSRATYTLHLGVTRASYGHACVVVPGAK